MKSIRGECPHAKRCSVGGKRVSFVEPRYMPLSLTKLFFLNNLFHFSGCHERVDGDVGMGQVSKYRSRT